MRYETACECVGISFIWMRGLPNTRLLIIIFTIHFKQLTPNVHQDPKLRDARLPATAELVLRRPRSGSGPWTLDSVGVDSTASGDITTQGSQIQMQHTQQRVRFRCQQLYLQHWLRGILLCRLRLLEPQTDDKYCRHLRHTGTDRAGTERTTGISEKASCGKPEGLPRRKSQVRCGLMLRHEYGRPPVGMHTQARQCGASVRDARLVCSKPSGV